MCEYCGCQAVAVIDELTREHDRALDHVRAAEHAARAGDLAAARAACLGLGQVLGPHTAVEEQGLFPALARDFPQHVHDLEAEHRRVEDALAGLDGPRATWAADLRDAMGVLRKHILKEQDGVFPAALGILTPSQWDALESVRGRVSLGPTVREGVTEEVARG